MKLEFLHGTETGSAEMLCEDMVKALEGEHSCSMQSMQDADPKALDGDTFYVVVVSTYGAGDLPFTAQPFFDRLKAEKPDLSAINFAIFGLGDSSFADTFNFGSQTIQDLMIECGARKFGERGLFDASGADFPEDVGLPWIKDIVSQRAVAA